MRTSLDNWAVPSLSTTSPDAVIGYRQGIAALVAGIAHADALLSGAVALDPDFYLAQLGLAVALAVMGSAFVPPPPAKGLTRGERQHAEIVLSTFAAAHGHASDLRREHLLEYPGDLLIVWLPSLRVSRVAST
jgi:hypothetical protein